MADVNANIGVNIDTSAALANLKALQRQISTFHSSMAKSGAAASAVSAGMQQNLINSINQTGKFSASMQNVRSTTESFTNALEKNKLGMREYFRYSAASTATFGRFFRTELDTINKVARERVKTLQTQYVKMGRDANGAIRAIAVRPLALDMQNLATQTQMAAQKQALFNQLVKQGSTNLLNFGKNTQWAGRQLMVGFTVPLTMLGVVAGKTFMQLEEQAIRFKRVYGETFTASAETEKMLEQIKELAQEFTKYGVAVEKTMEMAATAAASGKMGADLLAQVNEATRLAVLGGVEQQQALDTTISITNTFAVATEELTKKIDFLNAVENQTVVSIEDLTIAIPKAGPVVQQLGGDVEDLAFFLTAMKEGGINASEGANALKSGLAALINPTGKAAEMLKSFGINVQGIVESNKGDVKGLVLDFASALDTLDPLSRARAIEQLFGKFQFSRLSTLFKNVISEGNQASRVLQLTKATTEELAILSERELANIENTTTFRFKKAFEDIKNAIAPVGEEFLKAITPIIEIGTKILDAFNNLDSGAKTLIVNIVGIAGVIGPAFLMMFGLVANGFANLVKMFAFLGKAFSGTKSSTTDLAAQTQYMTNEQLEAAAVAASLDQAHMKLRQTFTSEAAAVNALTTAYQRSTAAQARFSGGVLGRTRAPKKYASGVISVPGPKGAGDVVPAMLSPGEAVIPAKEAQKYRGFISSMISGNIPGFKFGLNPFASMLGRSKVATRMSSQSFSQALASGNTKYQSGFATGTGDDFLSKYGRPKTSQTKLRSDLESNFFGMSSKTNAKNRSTFGFASTSPLQAILNSLLFGKSGARASSVMNPRSSSLDIYGDLSLITKNSVAKRSSAYAGDALLDYSRAPGGRNKNFPYSPAPMRGATPEQLEAARFGAFNQPFGSNQTGPNQFTTNRKPPYIETYTPGGFGFDEIDKVIAKNPAIVNQLKSELKAAGLGSIRVTGPGFAARLFKKMGVPGYSKGTVSVGSDGKSVNFKDISFATRTPKGSESLARTIAMLQEKGKTDDQITKRLQYLAGKSAERGSNFLTAKDLAKNFNLSPSGKELFRGAGKSSAPQSMTRSMSSLQGGYFEERKALVRHLRDNKIKMSNSQIRNLLRLQASHVLPAGSGQMKDWGNLKNLIPDLGYVNNYLNRVQKTLGQGLLGKSDADLRGLGIDRQELNKLVSGQHPTSASAAKTMAAIAKYDSAMTNNYQAKAASFGLDRRISEGYYTPGNIKTLEALKASGVIRSTTGVPKTSQTKVAGGAPLDNRLVAVSKGETVLSQKSTSAIKRGGAATVPGIGRMGRFGPMRVPGAFDGLPEGQTQTRSMKFPGTPATETAKDFAKEAPLTKEVKSNNFRKAIGGAFERGIKKISTPVANILDRAQEKKEARANARMANDQPRQMQPGRVLGAVGGAATLGVLGASMMPGDIGQMAQQAMMPIMMLSMVLPMLTSTVGIVAGGLIAVVGGFIAVQLALENIRKETAKTTRSLSSGKDAMSELAEIAGTVTPSEFMDKRRELEFSPFNVQPGKTTFGQSFVQTEAGQGMLSDFEAQAEKLGRSRAIESLQKKLTTAVATGVLSPEQAKSIANSLGQKLNDYNITANINASIQSILGPDGQVLEGNTIKIYTDFIQGSTSGITGTGGILQSQDFTDRASPLWWMDTERIAKQEGEAAGIIANFYDENQQIIDAFDAENLKNIDRLYAEEKYNEAIAAEEKYQTERKNLIASYNSEIASLQKDFAAVDFDNQQAILSQLTSIAKEVDAKSGEAAKRLQESSAILRTNAFGQSVSAAQVRAANSGRLTNPEEIAKDQAFQQVKVQFLGELAGGNIKPETFNGIMQMFDPATGTGQATLGVLAEISTKVGPSALDQLNTVLQVLDDPNLAAEILVDIQQKDPRKARESIDTLTKLSKFDGVGIESKVVLKYFGKNPEELDALTAKFEKLELLKKKGTLDVQTLVNQQVLTTGDLAAFKENETYFNSLDANQKVIYTQTYLTKLETVAENEIDAWYAANPDSKRPRDQVASLLATQAATEYTVANPTVDTTAVDNEQKTVGGAGAKESPYKTLLTDLKMVRQNAVDAAGGIAELVKWLGKGKDINVFRGTQNALIKLGSSSEFQEFLMGLDKVEQTKLFSINKGMATLTQRGKAVQKAFNKISLGRFVAEQQQAVQDSRNQRVAIERLTKSGMSLSDAYEAVADTAFAAAVATMKLGKKGQKELRRIIEEAKKAKAAVAEVMTPEELGDMLQDAVQTKIDRLELDFELAISVDSAVIADAQAKIEALNFKLDDYQAGLQEIEWQEDAINKKYEAQFEALEKVRSASSLIAQEAKSRLTLADALSQGDIAAAARAAQEIRERQADEALNNQEQSLKLAQEAELAALQDSNGRNRKQLNELILGVQRQIFAIEEKTLEPAQERIRLLEVEKDKLVAQFELQKLEYANLVLKIKELEQGTAAYVAQLDAALARLREMALLGPGGASAVGGTDTEQPKPQNVPRGTPPPPGPPPPPPPAPGTMSKKEAQAITNAVAAVKTAGPGAASVAASKTLAGLAGVNTKATSADAAERKINAAVASATKVAPKVSGPPPGPSLRAMMKANGGMVRSFMSDGGPTLGSDRIPAMLTPGEFVIRRPMVNKFGTKLFEQLNNGVLPDFNNMGPKFGANLNSSIGDNLSVTDSKTPSVLSSNPVYNNMYTVSVNVKSDSNPDAIAQAVIGQIRQIDSRQIRGNRF